MSEGSVSRAFGLSLSLYRRAAGMSQGEIANLLGITVVSYYRLEKGTGTTVRVSYLEALSRLFSVEPGDLFSPSKASRAFMSKKGKK